MTDEDLDMTRAGEAWSQYHLERRPNEAVPGMGDVCHSGHATIEVAYLAARLAREGWTPPDPLENEAIMIVAEHMGVPVATVEEHRDSLILIAPVLAALRRGMELAKP